MTIIIILCWLSVLGWSYLAFGHGQFWEPSELDETALPSSWPSVDIIIPARNEAEVLPQSLPSLLQQNYPGNYHIYIVDDHSQDKTEEVIQRLLDSSSTERVTLLKAPELPRGWSGKVAAMKEGLRYSHADYVLFTDADIQHSESNLRRLVALAITKKNDLVSLMVRLHCESFAEKLLVPAFVFFFMMLYPFRRVNDPQSRIAAAAGGVMLLKRQALDNIGGLEPIKSALIDDCSLAKEIKKRGGPQNGQGQISLMLTHDVVSIRSYPAIQDIWKMVARTAYTQLFYSPLLLVGTFIGMFILYLFPVFMFISFLGTSSITGLAVWLLMAVLYMPTVIFYRLPVAWAFSLPLAALIYIGATLDSARLYYQGKGGHWKGRSQA